MTGIWTNAMSNFNFIGWNNHCSAILCQDSLHNFEVLMLAVLGVQHINDQVCKIAFLGNNIMSILSILDKKPINNRNQPCTIAL